MPDADYRIFDAIENNDIDAVTALLASNSELVDDAPFGETPLHVAVEQGHSEIVRLLIQTGANVNRRGNNGQTPLHLAAARGRVDEARVLLAHGASIEAKSDYDLTPLLTAAKRGEPEVADALIEAGANYDFETAVSLGRVDRVKELISSEERVVENCLFRDDLLSDAVHSNNSELVEAILSLPGIDVNVGGDSGEPPLVAAVSRTDYSPEIVKLLLNHGADPLRVSSSGDNAFDRARSVGIENVEQLLS